MGRANPTPQAVACPSTSVVSRVVDKQLQSDQTPAAIHPWSLRCAPSSPRFRTARRRTDHHRGVVVGLRQRIAALVHSVGPEPEHGAGEPRRGRQAALTIACRGSDRHQFGGAPCHLRDKGKTTGSEGRPYAQAVGLCCRRCGDCDVAACGLCKLVPLSVVQLFSDRSWQSRSSRGRRGPRRDGRRDSSRRRDGRRNDRGGRGNGRRGRGDCRWGRPAGPGGLSRPPGELSGPSFEVCLSAPRTDLGQDGFGVDAMRQQSIALTQMVSATNYRDMPQGQDLRGLPLGRTRQPASAANRSGGA